MTLEARGFKVKLREKKSPLASIARDILKAAIDLEIFNISELSRKSKHSWDTVKRLLDIFLLKDSISIMFTTAEVPGHYKIIVVSQKPRRINKVKLKRALKS
jgi:hypothetical protein